MTPDLAALFGPTPRGPSQGVGFRQGVVVSWDPVTAANTVDVGGTVLTDLPILNTSEALLLEAGSVVSLLAVGDGAKTFAILGRYTLPGTAAAVSALTAVSQAIYPATVVTAEATTSGGFTDLATPGPEVEVRISDNRECLVIVSTTMSALVVEHGVMGFGVSGASSIGADILRSLKLPIAANNSVRASYVGRLTEAQGLNAGVNVFTAAYLSVGGASVTFNTREIVVIAL